MKYFKPNYNENITSPICEVLKYEDRSYAEFIVLN